MPGLFVPVMVGVACLMLRVLEPWQRQVAIAFALGQCTFILPRGRRSELFLEVANEAFWVSGAALFSVGAVPLILFQHTIGQLAGTQVAVVVIGGFNVLTAWRAGAVVQAPTPSFLQRQLADGW
ncbi:hypothetical protein D3C79_679160 [compost metagenome]